MQFGPAEVVGLDDLAEGGLHDRRATEEDPPDPLHHDHLIGERRHVGASGRAASEHHRELRQAHRRQSRLSVERPAEVILVGEDLVLQGQEGPAGVDQIDDAEAVLLGDLLSAHMLLDRDRHQGAALDGGVVGDEDVRRALDDTDAGDDPASGHLVAVLAPPRQGGELEERGVLVGDHVDPVAHHDFAAGEVPLDGALATRAAVDGPAHPLAQGVDEFEVGVAVGGEGR